MPLIELCKSFSGHSLEIFTKDFLMLYILPPDTSVPGIPKLVPKKSKQSKFLYQDSPGNIGRETMLIHTCQVIKTFTFCNYSDRLTSR